MCTCTYEDWGMSKSFKNFLCKLRLTFNIVFSFVPENETMRIKNGHFAKLATYTSWDAYTNQVRPEDRELGSIPRKLDRNQCFILILNHSNTHWNGVQMKLEPYTNFVLRKQNDYTKLFAPNEMCFISCIRMGRLLMRRCWTYVGGWEWVFELG